MRKVIYNFVVLYIASQCDIFGYAESDIRLTASDSLGGPLAVEGFLVARKSLPNPNYPRQSNRFRNGFTHSHPTAFSRFKAMKQAQREAEECGMGRIRRRVADSVRECGRLDFSFCGAIYNRSGAAFHCEMRIEPVRNSSFNYHLPKKYII